MPLKYFVARAAGRKLDYIGIVQVVVYITDCFFARFFGKIQDVVNFLRQKAKKKRNRKIRRFLSSL